MLGLFLREQYCLKIKGRASDAIRVRKEKDNLDIFSRLHKRNQTLSFHCVLYSTHNSYLSKRTFILIVVSPYLHPLPNPLLHSR